MNDTDSSKISKQEHWIRYAVQLLKAGLQPGDLPQQLMQDFALSPAQAQEAAKAGLKRYRGSVTQ